MGRFEANTDCIEEAVNALKELKETCETNKKEKKTFSGSDKGLVHEQLEQYATSISSTWSGLIQLIDCTIEFLGGAQNTFDQADSQGAAAIQKN